MLHTHEVTGSNPVRPTKLQTRIQWRDAGFFINKASIDFQQLSKPRQVPVLKAEIFTDWMWNNYESKKNCYFSYDQLMWLTRRKFAYWIKSQPPTNGINRCRLRFCGFRLQMRLPFQVLPLTLFFSTSFLSAQTGHKVQGNIIDSSSGKAIEYVCVGTSCNIGIQEFIGILYFPVALRSGWQALIQILACKATLEITINYPGYFGIHMELEYHWIKQNISKIHGCWQDVSYKTAQGLTQKSYWRVRRHLWNLWQ